MHFDLPVELANKFIAACKLHGECYGTVLKRFCESFIEKDSAVLEAMVFKFVKAKDGE